MLTCKSKNNIGRCDLH